MNQNPDVRILPEHQAALAARQTRHMSAAELFDQFVPHGVQMTGQLSLTSKNGRG